MVASAVSRSIGYWRVGGHRLFIANDREPTGIARFLSEDRDSQSACRTVGKQALSGTVGIEGSLIRRLRVRTQNERDEIRLKMPLRWAFGTVGSRHPADVWWPSDGLIYSARAGWQRRPTLVSIADPPLAVLVESNESPSAGSELCSLQTRLGELRFQNAAAVRPELRQCRLHMEIVAPFH